MGQAKPTNNYEKPCSPQRLLCLLLPSNSFLSLLTIPPYINSALNKDFSNRAKHIHKYRHQQSKWKAIPISLEPLLSPFHLHFLQPLPSTLHTKSKISKPSSPSSTPSLFYSSSSFKPNQLSSFFHHHYLLLRPLSFSTHLLHRKYLLKKPIPLLP